MQGEEQPGDQRETQGNAEGDLQGGGTVGIKFFPVTGDHRIHGAVKGAAGDQGHQSGNTKDGGGCFHQPCHSFGKQLTGAGADGGSRQIPKPKGMSAEQIYTPDEYAPQGAGEKLFLFYVEKKRKAKGAQKGGYQLNDDRFHGLPPQNQKRKHKASGQHSCPYQALQKPRGTGNGIADDHIPRGGGNGNARHQKHNITHNDHIHV